jgi:tetratricopeptide (TPR) repeat protein
VVLFITLPLLSLDAGISGDEEVHYKQSVKVYNYYKSLGEDKSALETPKSHLKYYGQSFDNITTILIKWFNIKDVYKFRHLANALAGWLTIFLAGLLAVFLGGYRAGIFVLILMMLSPRFIGHSWNNLKDIPFALGYIASVYLIFWFLKKLPKTGIKTIVFLILSLAFAISIRISGVLLICYLLLFLALYIASENLGGRLNMDRKQWVRLLLMLGGITLLSYVTGLLLWPYGLENPVKNPITAYKVMARFPTTLRQIFEGKVYWSDQFPWYYLLKYMGITVPLIILTGFLCFMIFFRKIMKGDNWLYIFFLLFSFLFPLAFIIMKGSNVYGAWRHIIFIFPPLVILAALGFNALIESVNKIFFRIGFIIIFLILSIHPFRFMLRNHPYEYLYFNELTGGFKGAYGSYETDYYFHSIREASEWLVSYLEENNITGSKVKVAMNFPGEWFFRNCKVDVSTQIINYYYRGNFDWDYAIIANEYLSPYQLKNSIWPPENTIHKIRVDGVPVCAILKRKSKDDYRGFVAMKSRAYDQAKILLKNALRESMNNEAALINLAEVYIRTQEFDSAKIFLDKCLEIYPDYEVALNQLALIAGKEKKYEEAERLFKKILRNNNKYFPAYASLAQVYFDTGEDELAKKSLLKCLSENPHYKPALKMMGFYYQKQGNTEKAEKYFNYLKKL